MRPVANTGSVDHLLDTGRQRDRVAQRQVHAAPDQVEVVEGGEGEVEEIQVTGGFEPLRDLLGVVEGESPGDELVGAEAHAQGEVGAHRLADGGDQLQSEPHPVLEVAAVLVVPEVGERRHELAGQGAVAELQLHPVEPALAGMGGAAGEVIDHLTDVLDLHGLGRLAVEHVRDGRGGPDGQPGQAAAALLPVVVQLGEDAGVVGVDRPGEPPVGRDDLRSEGLDEVLVGAVGGVDGLLFGDDQAGPARARAAR